MWMGKLKYYSQHHVLMKGGKFMGAYFYSIILFVFSALSFSFHLIHAACISNIVVLINFHLNHPHLIHRHHPFNKLLLLHYWLHLFCEVDIQQQFTNLCWCCHAVNLQSITKKFSSASAHTFNPYQLLPLTIFPLSLLSVQLQQLNGKISREISASIFNMEEQHGDTKKNG